MCLCLVLVLHSIYRLGFVNLMLGSFSENSLQNCRERIFNFLDLLASYVCFESTGMTVFVFIFVYFRAIDTQTGILIYEAGGM